MPDMTLIATAWVPEGFVIVADGFSVLSTFPLRTSERAQKIFPTTFANGTGFAFAWWGAIRFVFESGIRLDFVEITQQVLEQLPDYAYVESPEDYFEIIARTIFCELPSNVGLSDQFQSDVVFVGYLSGVPLRAEINFPHHETGFLRPVVKELKRPPECFKVVAGSETVAREMRASGLISQPGCLSEAIDMVRLYAQTCVDKKEVIPDCRNFGGHVHVASVMRNGFRWEVAP